MMNLIHKYTLLYVEANVIKHNDDDHERLHFPETGQYKKVETEKKLWRNKCKIEILSHCYIIN